LTDQFWNLAGLIVFDEKPSTYSTIRLQTKAYPASRNRKPRFRAFVFVGSNLGLGYNPPRSKTNRNECLMDINDLPQPLGFYHVLTLSDALHYGYWPDTSENNLSFDLCQAQRNHSQLILQGFPKPPAKILDVGCGLGLMAGDLHRLGYHVTAIAPSESLISHAKEKHSGPDFINCGFLDEQAAMQNGQFDVLLFQESLQYFPDLPAVFDKAARLLSENGRLLVCDEVSYDDITRQRSAVHSASAVESSFSAQGFYVHQHETMGEQVTPTCEHVLAGLSNKKQQLIAIFGAQVEQEIEQLIVEWHKLQNWYQNKVFGYEFWQLRHSPYLVRSYKERDEKVIVEKFNQVYQKNRSLDHWRWRYLANPQGGPYISTAWDGQQLISHYSAYPLALNVDAEIKQTYHVGDTFTMPAWRGVGFGKSSLLSRTVRHFHKIFCETKVDFFYGFNLVKIQKLGQRFLSYVPIAPVYEYSLSAEHCSTAKLFRVLKGYRITIVEESDAWADELYEQAKKDYVMFIIRDKSYLQWRYDQHSDFSYQYMLLKNWGKVVGWCVTRKTEQALMLIDAFCLKKHSKQLVRSLHELLSCETSCVVLSGWFAANPSWWCEQLIDGGFRKKRQAQNLDLCATFFSQQHDKTDLANKFYYTMGDSDLY